MRAADAYDAFAPIYDKFNEQNDYEGWFSVLLPELEKCGLRQGEGGRLLDAGCGTGRAFEPMLRRGWRILGCDVSSDMLAYAADQALLAPDRVWLMEADIRELPTGEGTFHLVWALNDVMNYLTEDGDLERALAGMKTHLARDGLLVFDANTFRQFEESFKAGGGGEITERGWKWEGLAEEIVTGGTYEARLSGEGVETHVHRERHYSIGQVLDAMTAVGLAPAAVLGQSEEDGRVILGEGPDELADLKIVYVGRAE